MRNQITLMCHIDSGEPSGSEGGSSRRGSPGIRRRDTTQRRRIDRPPEGAGGPNNGEGSASEEGSDDSEDNNLQENIEINMAEARARREEDAQKRVEDLRSRQLKNVREAIKSLKNALPVLRIFYVN